MRRLLLCLLVALCAPTPALAGARVSAFYYPWYSTASHDGSYAHWGQRGHAPPDDIASAYYPARGLYSSSDRLVLGAQMDDVARAGIDELAVSWWGRGSPEDARLPAGGEAAPRRGPPVAAHSQPHGRRHARGPGAGLRV